MAEVHLGKRVRVALDWQAPPHSAFDDAGSNLYAGKTGVIQAHNTMGESLIQLSEQLGSYWIADEFIDELDELCPRCGKPTERTYRLLIPYPGETKELFVCGDCVEAYDASLEAHVPFPLTDMEMAVDHGIVFFHHSFPGWEGEVNRVKLARLDIRNRYLHPLTIASEKDDYELATIRSQVSKEMALAYGFSLPSTASQSEVELLNKIWRAKIGEAIDQWMSSQQIFSEEERGYL